MDLAMAALDPDGDGQISFDEFARFWGEDGAHQTTGSLSVSHLCLVCVLTFAGVAGSGVDRLASMEAALKMVGATSPRAAAKAGGSDSDDDEDADWSEDD